MPKKARQRQPLTPRVRIAVALLPALLILGAGEVATRTHYAHVHQDAGFLIAPFGRLRVSPPVEYPMAVKATYRKQDACTGRELTYTINAQGGRGKEWVPAKAPGTLRILALGGSTTFGINNPDDATWPALLEEELQRRGSAAEVLNGGSSGSRIEQLINNLSTQWLPYHPDAVLYYEAYNNAPETAFRYSDLAISRFHSTWLGRVAALLYNRSMLYTYLLEKAHFQLAKQRRIVPELRHYQAQVTRLLHLLRRHRIAPVFVLQVMAFPEDPRLRRVNLEDEQALAALIPQERETSVTSLRDSYIKTRVALIQVFVEAVRRSGEAAGIQVIDPRPAFAAHPNPASLFCDHVHLTDGGNRLLASAIADQLDLAGVAGGRPTAAASREQLFYDEKSSHQ